MAKKKKTTAQVTDEICASITDRILTSRGASRGREASLVCRTTL